MMFPRSIYLVLLVLLVLCVPVISPAQGTTGAIAGIVQDSTGAVVPGAEVFILHRDTGISRTVGSDAQGRYQAPNLAVGNYEIIVTAPGFRTENRTGFTLTVGQRAAFNFTLEPSGVAETVTVTGAAPLVDTSSTEIGALVNRQQIQELPLNGRDYTQLAALQPGVVAYREQNMNPNRGLGVRLSISGARHNQVAYRLNGIDINDGAGTTPGSAAGRNLGVDAIQEFQVLTNTFTAEQGRSAGGIVNIVHKSGTNAFHGSAFEYLRDSSMDAPNYFDDGDQPPFRRNQFGFSGGGPILHNRTFFFGAYEGLREHLTTTRFANVLTAAAKNGALGPIDPRIRPYLDVMPTANLEEFPNGIGVFSQQVQRTARENYFVGKIDHTFSGSDSVSASYTYDKGQVGDPTDLGLYTVNNRSKFQYATFQHTHIFSSNMLHTLRFGYNDSAHFVTHNPDVDIPASLAFVPGATTSSVSVDGLDSLDMVFEEMVERDLSLKSYQVGSVLNWFRGAHSIKGGMEASFFKVHNQTFGRAGGGLYGFNSIPSFLAAQAFLFEGTDPNAPQGNTVDEKLFGFFVQDDIRIGSSVTLNAGLRYEFITLPRSDEPIISTLVNLTDPELTTGRTFFQNPSLKNFAPRAGIAWDVFGNQRTALRVGAGLYHDQITSYYYIPVIGSNPPFRLGTELRNPPFPGAFAQTQAVGGPYALTLMEYDLKQPSRLQYNVGVQQQLGDRMAAAVYFVGARSYNSSQYFVNANGSVPAGRTADGRLFFAPNPRPLNPKFGVVQLRTATGDSWYKSLQLVLNARPSGGLSYQVSYTLQKLEDTGSVQSFTSEGLNTGANQNLYQRPDEEKGLSAYDQRHTLSVNANYHLPFGNSWTGPAQVLAAGWQVSGILNLASGNPFSPELAFDNANVLVRSGSNFLRPDLKPGGNPNPIQEGNAERYFDLTQFLLPPSGTLGNLPRNTIIGPGMVTFDFSAKKRFGLGGARALEFRAEIFNVFNRVNFRVPKSSDRRIILRGGAYNPTAGRLTATSTTARQMQVSARFEF